MGVVLRDRCVVGRGETGSVRGPGNGGLGAAAGALPVRAVASGSVTATRSSTGTPVGSGRQQLGPAVPRAPDGALVAGPP
ncbi:hypothetical protein Kpho02_62280 [Kitasatospora phosalacinea]|uniref:Uncharacterized protein n=1 Tax=Kitasatospora phosalacinea TaxID=2065 RepID=A0A9W6QCI4_9ACTN|nr:hypothetical protein Kpho02_62280 [Kitasatospora phosalacinea]